MMLRGGQYSSKGGKRKCESLIAQPDGSLLMKNNGLPCADYKLDLLKSEVSGKISTRCKHAIYDGCGGKIMCSKV